ncbi:hypothetical protein B1810_04325 [Panacagrimonas perspica]|nr:glycosyltransferase family 87 protein [Panacagrimonas perspica]THD04791.1 hypothetical protein B1810_04325 [Panacagrimonas perspica]
MDTKNPGDVRKTHWLDAERLRVYPWLFISVYVVLGAAWIALSHDGVDIKGKPLGYDFIAFWAASRVALEQSALAAYDLATIVQAEREVFPGILTAHPWHYPPTFYLLVLPLSLLPYALSFIAFTGATLGAYIAVLRRALPQREALPWLFAFPGTMLNLFHGQNAFLTAALMGGGLLCLQRRPVTAGVLLGLLAIKPHLGLLIPVALAAGGHWRAFAGAALSSVTLLGLSSAVLGVETLAAFVDRLPHVSQWVANNQLPQVKMPTLFVTTLMLGGPTWLAYALHIGLTMGAAAALWWLWRAPVTRTLQYAGLCCAALLASPYLFDYDLAWLALPLAWSVRHGLEHGWRPGEREILMLAWLLPIVFQGLAVVTHLGIGPFVIGALFIVILRQAGRERTPGIPV